MIEENAHVVERDGEYAWVETERRSSCSSCSTKGCGTGALSKVLGRKVQRLRVRNPIAAEAGDEVVLGIEEGALVKGALLVYLLPLLAMMLGGLLGEALEPQLALEGEGLTLVMALLALLLSFLWLYRFNRRLGADGRYSAVILRRITPGLPGEQTISFHLKQ